MLNIIRTTTTMMIALTLSSFVCVGANAAFIGPQAGGNITVEEIIKSPYDDMHVTLHGHIIKQLSKDKYIFRDKTGEVIVKINEDKMASINVTPETPIKISGKVDVEVPNIKVDVRVITVVSN